MSFISLFVPYFLNKKWSILNKYTPVFDVRLSNANIQFELGIHGVDFFSRIVLYNKVWELEIKEALSFSVDVEVWVCWNRFPLQHFFYSINVTVIDLTVNEDTCKHTRNKSVDLGYCLEQRDVLSLVDCSGHDVVWAS